MYRDFDFSSLRHTFFHEMNWWWMMFSLVFGVTAQLFRGLRWKSTLEPLGEYPRRSDCVHAVFLSYALSIVIPRIGEVARCGILTKYDGTSFPKALGTVVTERIIDSLLVMTIAVLVFFMQIKVFGTFFDETGMSILEILRGFTATGYIVTAVCTVTTIAFLYVAIHKMAILSGVKKVVCNIKEGMTSLRNVKNKPLFVFYTLAIWVSYFLHYYITFYCFDFTEHLSLTAALVSFIVGSISVIVPTPNGAGPWHFAVKTILILYGIAENDAVTFVLIVHTVQTALVPLLGIYSAIVLQTRDKSAAVMKKERNVSTMAAN
ncbi:MAG: flippase-like domain-containing protein [Bacteroides sp.]|nr:flippase-like domain-containing protein [Bacteroides sp.]MCM1420169.1 flippase-like domain-containing protein [Bacteroides sp.]